MYDFFALIQSDKASIIFRSFILFESVRSFVETVGHPSVSKLCTEIHLVCDFREAAGRLVSLWLWFTRNFLPGSIFHPDKLLIFKVHRLVVEWIRTCLAIVG